MSEISDDLSGRLRDLVHARTGMYFDERKKYFFGRRLERRLEATHIADPWAYLDRIQSDGLNGEFQLLAESLTTNETYFFREYGQLQCFADVLLPELLEERRKAGNRTLRIWSAGCSSGEEPYTLAIILRALIDDLAGWRISLQASDISQEMLAFARRGVYGERSVRNVPDAYRERWFTQVADGWRINPDVAAMVTFDHANLTHEPDVRRRGPLDFVFCRNVLIYFDDHSRRATVEAFHDVLRPGGYIFLGHSESVGRITSAFRLERKGDQLVYRK